jgi:subtilase family serine protease
MPGDAGVRMHTNHLIILNGETIHPDTGGSGPSGSMIPSDLRRFYNLPSTGGSGIIAIVDAYNDPYALSDFNTFSSLSYIGLPTETSTNVTSSTNKVFQVVYASGKKPSNNSGWSQEEALDIEWAHAMAPNAKIVLFEAASASNSALYAAVDAARNYVDGNGLRTKVISMSWSGGESSGETSTDSAHFPQGNGIVYFASSGDTGGLIQYPACSPNVVGVGGTTLNTDANHNLLSETGWSGSGGGISVYETKPSYQVGVANTNATHRSTPDIAAEADPNTGVLVVWNGGGYIFGGTSVACPCTAGMVDLSGVSYADTQTFLTHVYSGLGGSNFRDITSGTAGSFSCLVGWDFVTGVGSPLGTGF